nr:retrovirus-related Pol polyprotein from transposon TNT 1-94 [Tanacetum cinerariifolium]
KFVTDVKLVKDLHTTNFDKLHAYLEQYVLYENEVRLMRERNQDPLGRTPSIGFMRPFGCHVTILNILDPLGKFNRKADEGFLVRYSVTSKAFRVFNSSTRIVQETLHINLLENQPNVAGVGPKWLFDIDTLTQSMNYQPVVAGIQPNHNAGIQENINVDMPALEDIVYLDDEEDVGAEADFSNLETNISVSLILTTRVHKYHHVSQIIGELTTAPQTRSMARMVKEQDLQNTDADVAFDIKENENEVHVSPSSSDKPKNMMKRLKEKLKERVL